MEFKFIYINGNSSKIYGMNLKMDLKKLKQKSK